MTPQGHISGNKTTIFTLVSFSYKKSFFMLSFYASTQQTIPLLYLRGNCKLIRIRLTIRCGTTAFFITFPL
jgi:hypothetical protein